MKRTFGRFMSLLLVFAMVLAMVPAVLAATNRITSFTGEARALEPYGELTINYGEEKTAAKTPSTGYEYASTISSWKCSNTDLLKMTVDSVKQEVTLTSRGGTGKATITAYYKEGTTEKTAATWNVTVSEYTITFMVDGKNYTDTSTAYALSANSYVDLAVKVTGPSGRVEGLKVKFTSAAANIASIDAANRATATKDLYMGSSETTGTTEESARIMAGSGNGEVKITVALMKADGTTAVVDSSNNPVTKSFLVDVAGSADYQIKFTNTELTDTNPENRVLAVAYNTENGSLTPALYKGTKKVSSTKSAPITFSYDSSNSSLVWVNDSDGEIRLQDSTQQLTGRAKITVHAYLNGNEIAATTYCYIDVVSSTTTGLTLTLHDESYKALVTDGKKLCASTTSGQSVSGFTLIPKVTPGDANADKNRIVWKSSDPSIATVKYSNTTHTAYVQVVGYGSFNITATLDGKTVTYQKFATNVPCYAWQEVKYTREQSVKPNISGPISNSGINDAIDAIANQTIEVKIAGTGVAKRLPILRDSVLPEYTDNGMVSFTGYIDGIDEENHILYCPTTQDKDDKFKTDAVTLSSIDIIQQPEDTKYKVGSTGSLTIRARVGQSGDKLKTFQWFNQRNELVFSDDVSSRNLTVATSTLDLSASGVIDASSSSNSFYCVVTSTKNQTARSYTANVVTQGDYTMKITASKTTVQPGDQITLSAVAQRYNPSASGSNKWVEVTNISSISWTLDQSSVAKLSKTTSSRGENITLTANSGGEVKVTARATDNSGNVYENTQTITITVPTANDVSVMLDDGATYALLDGSKLADAVKAATKTTPSYFSFTKPESGTLYTSSSLTGSVVAGNKYSASEVSKMAFRPSKSAGSYTIAYAAYDANGQIATGKILVMTSAGTVEYHISANESQQMLVSDFQAKYGSGLSSIVFGANTDTRGALYKGSSTGSGKVGSEAYTTSTLRNVYFIAGSTASKYSVTIPYTANGSNGERYGNLVIYVNDTHSVYSTGATFKSMSIAEELTPESGSSSAYVTIDKVTGGMLYTQYSSIKSCTQLANKDLGSTKFYLSGSNSVDSLYLLPMADSKTVEVAYTLNGSTKGTITFKVVKQTSSNKFTDVSGSSNWAANSVDFMYANSLVNGVSTSNPNIFGPDQTMTRAMLVTILYRAAGEPSVAGITNKFTDNKQGQYYYEPVLWASSKGVVTGASATTFDPDGKITREQIAAILFRYAGEPTTSGSLSGFSDQSQVSAYAVKALQWAVGSGIITGISTNGRTTLSAKGNATRAQVAVMLHRFLTLG